MNGIESFIQWVTSLVSEHLYAGVFLAALLETIFPPIPTLAIFPLAGYIASQNDAQFFQVILLGIAGGSGATIGSTVIYLIALKLGRVALLRYLRYAKITGDKLSKVEKWFEKHGDKSVLFGRMVPVLRELISIPAGILKMKPIKFIIYTFVGSCVWSIATIMAGYYFGITVIKII